MKMLPALTFLIGAAVGGLAVGQFGGASAIAREETKMAFINRSKAIEQGDREMQRYFEEVITWNAVMRLSPRFFDGPYGDEVTWLDDASPDGAYRRIKDGVSYAELLSIAKERKVFGNRPVKKNQAEQAGASDGDKPSN